ncbi:Metallophosphoesterase mpped2 [Halocaridina rubra]|uniref:Metallophosphoesterase mpped2 n=1 Tax=Halocaridina rubra TaxID=373956 RepID=A0AAN8WMQ5_HALRR
MNNVVDKMKKFTFKEDLSCNPNAAWDLIKEKQVLNPIDPLNPKEIPISPNMVRFVCLSDTHNRTSDMIHSVPDGDVLLHAGDFTRNGTQHEARKFNDWLGTLPHPYKIVIGGNHELLLDAEASTIGRAVDPSEVLSNATSYLCDSSVTVHGLKIYGAPWTPVYHVMAFNVIRGSPIRKKWDRIPKKVDVLMTHGPPLGRGDRSWRKEHCGCVDLLHTIQKRVKPKFHVCGHIHEGYGITSDGHTTYINASICDVAYEPVNAPIVFDLPLPQGYSKDK